ncbi:AN1-type zinc finger protein 2A [Uranotaenia lowii]|uniref:AN1-type zinc finger protein 2A n=1 Tax=Uranotaenia lowii TaxID=190385 RepID=UPI002479B28F|nr:AN1-type zinc finger protein 2A [Uranotaenia lowii]
MEFPHLGKHCSEKFCNKLDFLPMKCDACGAIFCSEHFSYQTHSCPSAYKKDVQVPICPLCSEPVPTPRDVSPDITVGAHIDQYCKSEKNKIYTNRCTFKNCKKKELVPFNCTVCKMNYCLKHRHTADHECYTIVRPAAAPQVRTTAGIGSILAGRAAMQRQQQAPSTGVQPRSLVTAAGGGPVQSKYVSSLQGNMSEDEALARALALSMQEEEAQRTNAQQPSGSGTNNSRTRGITVGGNGKDKCNLS